MTDDRDPFANLQRLNSAVLAKYQWTASLIGMQKSGEEIHQRRNRNHRKVNEFIQELLRKRTDVNALDDQGALERYRQFLRSRQKLDDDDLLDEFNRRLRALNRHPRSSTRFPLNSSFSKGHSNSTIDIQTDDLESNITDRSTSPIQFPSDLSLTENQTESFSPMETSSTRSSHNPSVHRPQAQRIQGNEIIRHSPSSTPPIQAASNVLLFNNHFFPRSLTRQTQTRTDRNTNDKPTISDTVEQFNRDEVFHMLDQLDRACPQDQFTSMLSNLKMSPVPLIHSETKEKEIKVPSSHLDFSHSTMIFSNLFDHTASSEKYFTSFTVTIDNPRSISVYPMTIGTIALTSNRCVPYSILNGHRPVLQPSSQTNFQRVRSRNHRHSCEVTGIDSISSPTENLQKNDIILKINDQDVWRWTTDRVRKILFDYGQRKGRCSFTIARLCQPFTERHNSRDIFSSMTE